MKQIFRLIAAIALAGICYACNLPYYEAKSGDIEINKRPYKFFYYPPTSLDPNGSSAKIYDLEGRLMLEIIDSGSLRIGDELGDVVVRHLYNDAFTYEHYIDSEGVPSPYVETDQKLIDERNSAFSITSDIFKTILSKTSKGAKDAK